LNEQASINNERVAHNKAIAEMEQLIHRLKSDVESLKSQLASAPIIPPEPQAQEIKRVAKSFTYQDICNKLPPNLSKPISLLKG
jgi:hypothetical protein